MLADAKTAHYARYALKPIPDPSVDDALRAAVPKLKGVLLFHVVAGHISAHETGRMRDGDKVKTVSGKEFTLGAHGEVITVNGANVTTRDMMARNGVIHAIDRLIMPS